MLFEIAIHCYGKHFSRGLPNIKAGESETSLAATGRKAEVVGCLGLNMCWERRLPSTCMMQWMTSYFRILSTRQGSKIALIGLLASVLSKSFCWSFSRLSECHFQQTRRKIIVRKWIGTLQTFVVKEKHDQAV